MPKALLELVIVLYRSFLWLLFLVSFSFGYEVSEPKKHQNLNHHITVLYDTEERYTTQNLPKELFRKPSTLALGYQKGVVWSKLELQGIVQTEILCINPKVNLNTLDVFVFEGNNLISTHKLGNYRSLSNSSVMSKFANFSLTLDPSKHYTIYTRIKSNSLIDTSWYLSSKPLFISFVMIDILFWGAFFGFIFSLILYNLSVFVHLKEYAYVAYAFHGLSALLFQFATNGVFYQFGLYENLFLFNSLSWVFAQISLISILLFAVLFLDTKNSMPKLHSILLGLFFVVFGMMIIFIYSFFNEDLITLVRGVTKPLSISILLFVLIIAIVAV